MLYGIGALPLGLSALGLVAEYYLYGDMTPNDKLSKRESTSGYDKKEGSKLSIMDALKDPTIQKTLIGTGGCWFLFDVAAYGVGLIAGEILRDITNTTDDNVSSNKNIANITSKECVAIVFATLMSLTALLVGLPYLGLKKLQMASFGLSTFFLLLFACLYEYYQSLGQYKSLNALFVLTTMSLNSGQNITTYTLPSALYPKEIRSTFHGISSALGKAGAFIAAFTFIYIGGSARYGSYGAVLGICTVMSALGGILTYYCVDEGILNTFNSVAPSPVQLAVAI